MNPKHIMIDSSLLRNALQYTQIFPPTIYESESPEIRQKVDKIQAEGADERGDEAGNDGDVGGGAEGIESVVEGAGDKNVEPSNAQITLADNDGDDDDDFMLLPEEILEKTKLRLEAIKEQLPKVFQNSWKKVCGRVDSLFSSGVEPENVTTVNTKDSEMEVRHSEF